MNTFTVYKGTPRTWNLLTQGASLYATEEWLKAMGDRVDGMHFSFLMERTAQPVAGMYATMVSHPWCYEAFNAYQMLVGDPPVFPLGAETVRQRAVIRQLAPPRQDWFPNLVAMFPGYQCYLIGPDATSSDVVEEMVVGIIDWSQKQGLALVSFLYTTPEEETLERVLCERGCHRMPLTFRCDLRLWETSFDEYLGRLHKKRRNAIRKELKALRSAGIVTCLKRLDDCFADVVRLRCNLLRKYGHSADEGIEHKRLEAIVRSFPREQVIVCCAEKEGGLLGFTIFIAYEGTWYSFWTGSDYANPLSRYVYFDTCFYTAISEALSRGIGKIHYGIGHWEAKKARGCDVVPLNGWIYPLCEELKLPVAQLACCAEHSEYDLTRVETLDSKKE